MKQITNTKNTLVFLVAGLLITMLTPVIDRYTLMPDGIKGFLTGLGLALEFIALVKMQKLNRNALLKCKWFSN